MLTEDQDQVHVTVETLEKYAGVPRYRNNEAEEEDLVGVTTGLAWTEVGGELLSIEAVISTTGVCTFCRRQRASRLRPSPSGSR